MPIAAIIQAVLASLSMAPKVAELAAAVKQYFTALFNAGLITKEMQDTLHAKVDADLALFESGVVPPHWQVQTDPVQA